MISSLPVADSPTGAENPLAVSLRDIVLPEGIIKEMVIKEVTEGVAPIILAITIMIGRRCWR